MYQVLLVEDEQIIRRGIKKGVRWEELGFQVSAEAEDGAEALEYVKDHPVDVVVTDIKMPEMNGLELSRRLRQEYPHIQIIVLSGYAEFEYAREAVSFGAFEYLVKPVRKEMVEDILVKLRTFLDQKQQEEKELEKHMSIYHAGLEQLRKHLLTELLDGSRKAYSNLYEEIMQLELDIINEDVTAAVIKIDPLPVDFEEHQLIQRYHELFMHHLQALDHCSFMIRNAGEINLLLSGDKEGRLRLAAAMDAVMAALDDEMFSHTETMIKGGIGMTYPFITHVHKSFQQANKAIDKNLSLTGPTLNLFREGIEYEFESQWVKEYPSMMSRIVEEVLNGEKEKTSGLIGEMFAHFEEKSLNSEIVKNYCYILAIMLKNTAYGIVRDETEEVIDGSFEDQIKRCLSIEELNSLMKSVFSQMAELIRKSGRIELSKENYLIEQAKAYIRENYKKKISLDEICGQLYLSTTYFSYFFKKETGESYMDYLLKLRMEEAKRLLRETNQKVYEIVEEVGYSDYKYFVGQFRKCTGMTPKEYRNK